MWQDYDKAAYAAEQQRQEAERQRQAEEARQRAYHEQQQRYQAEMERSRSQAEEMQRRLNSSGQSSQPTLPSAPSTSYDAAPYNDSNWVHYKLADSSLVQRGKWCWGEAVRLQSALWTSIAHRVFQFVLMGGLIAASGALWAAGIAFWIFWLLYPFLRAFVRGAAHQG